MIAEHKWLSAADPPCRILAQVPRPLLASSADAAHAAATFAHSITTVHAAESKPDFHRLPSKLHRSTIMTFPRPPTTFQIPPMTAEIPSLTSWLLRPRYTRRYRRRAAVTGAAMGGAVAAPSAAAAAPRMAPTVALHTEAAPISAAIVGATTPSRRRRRPAAAALGTALAAAAIARRRRAR